MIINVYESKEALAKAGATLIASQIISKDECNLGLATGSSPVGLYQELVKLYQQGVISFEGVRSFNLDEYVGLEKEHDQSYYHFMQENLFSHVDIDPQNIHIPNGIAEDLDAECWNYDTAIEDIGGVDLQLLGIGRNGHIGFNEPDELFTSGTHVTDLQASTIEANSRFFASDDEVPRQAISMGIGTIMKAKKILLIASGKDKAEAIEAMIYGEVDPQCTASILQLHPDVTVLLDKEAASLIED